MKNPWSKHSKPGYYTVTVDSWTWTVHKVWSDPRKPYARAFCTVATPMTYPGVDMGDVYATEVPGLIAAWQRAVARVEIIA